PSPSSSSRKPSTISHKSFPPAPDRKLQACDGFTDCVGTCITQEMCTTQMYASNCEEVVASWPFDEYCDDGSYGVDFRCDEFSNDSGSCGGGGGGVPTTGGGGTYGGDTGGSVPVDNGECAFTDCVGTCITESMCVSQMYASNCDEVVASWPFDEYCDDGSYGVDFRCDEFSNDSGSCDGGGGGTTGGGGGVPTTGGGGTYGGDTGGSVPVDNGECAFTDCVGTCITESMCVSQMYASNCDEVVASWPFDEFCDDGSYGVDFRCDEFSNDSGSCDGGGGGTTGGGGGVPTTGGGGTYGGDTGGSVPVDNGECAFTDCVGTC
ncbi:hypothetical protein TeGR_g8755, partial [Tetraparma gracilis]